LRVRDAVSGCLQTMCSIVGLIREDVLNYFGCRFVRLEAYSLSETVTMRQELHKDSSMQYLANCL
jgi:hypothetical protein